MKKGKKRNLRSANNGHKGAAERPRYVLSATFPKKKTTRKLLDVNKRWVVCPAGEPRVRR